MKLPQQECDDPSASCQLVDYTQQWQMKTHTSDVLTQSRVHLLP